MKVSGTVIQERVDPLLRLTRMQDNVRLSGGPRKGGMQSQGWQCSPPAEGRESEDKRGGAGVEERWKWLAVDG